MDIPSWGRGGGGGGGGGGGRQVVTIDRGSSLPCSQPLSILCLSQVFADHTQSCYKLLNNSEGGQTFPEVLTQQWYVVPLEQLHWRFGNRG